MSVEKENNIKTVAVCGLGYVGYPVSILFADAGFHVIGIDVLERELKNLTMVKIRLKDGTGLNNLVEKVFTTGRFRATSDVTEYKNADYIIVAVQTPVAEEDKKPKYKHLRGID